MSGFLAWLALTVAMVAAWALMTLTDLPPP